MMESIYNDSTNNAEREEENAVNVYLRIRPSCLDENCGAEYFVVNNSSELTVDLPDDTYSYKSLQRTSFDHLHRFSFTKIFTEDVSQKHLFEGSVSGSIQHFLSGFDTLIFTYGVTNSGKTFTLVGDLEQPGLLHNTLKTIFDHAEKSAISDDCAYFPKFFNSVAKTNSEFVENINFVKNELFCQSSTRSTRKSMSSLGSGSTGAVFQSAKELCRVPKLEVIKSNMFIPSDGVPCTHYVYMAIAEIYNEKIFDLLNLKMINNLNQNLRKSPLCIGVDCNDYSYIKDLTYIPLLNLDEALKIIDVGSLQRQVAKTRLNMQSSRSHVMYSIKMIKVYHLPNDVVTTCNEMCFVDLAGSERPSKTMSVGMRFKEASNINLSLHVLGKCIEVLRQNKHQQDVIVPFRESKLTRLLQPFFIGNSSVNLFANISTDMGCFDETINVLRFSALTREALARPLTTSLVEFSEFTQSFHEEEYISMTKSELLRKLKSSIKKMKILENEKYSIESNIRRECFEENHKVICNLEHKHMQSLNDVRRSLVEFYKNKLNSLEEYYQSLLNVKNEESIAENCSRITLIEAELIKKSEELDILKHDYMKKLDNINKTELEDTKGIELLQNEILMYQNKCSLLEETENTTQTELEQATNKISSLEHNINILGLENSDIKNQLADKMVEIEKLLEKSVNSKLEIPALQTIIEEKDKKIADLECQNKYNNRMLVDTTNELTELKEKYLESERLLGKNKRKVERHGKTMKMLRLGSVEKDDVIIKLKNENKDLLEKIKKYSSEVTTTRNKIPLTKFDGNSCISDSSFQTMQKTPKTGSNTFNLSHFEPSTPLKRTFSPNVNTPSTPVNKILDDSLQSGVAFRRLYEDTREYALKMEERVKDLQNELNRSTSINCSVLNQEIVSSSQHFSPVEVKDEKKKRLSIKRKHDEIGNINAETSASVVFGIRSVSPDSRKREKENYVKRLRRFDSNLKDNENNIVDTVKKKLNLI